MNAPTKSPPTTNPCRSRACSRMRWVSLHLCWLTHRYREQARSHRGIGCVYKIPVQRKSPVGAELARECGGSACICVG
ncbi:hypothetical protein C9I49_27610 [Pseudomonas prosekii]|uniref:Uncharacterized protein n=1 Tax=Pseudomonas prosekii TaxID=1148509 RepID=A0A2U2D0B8_9PSED|nr:hypothetical protein C9I49_27610 [Pseudomonas prosekii]